MMEAVYGYPEEEGYYWLRWSYQDRWAIGKYVKWDEPVNGCDGIFKIAGHNYSYSLNYFDKISNRIVEPTLQEIRASHLDELGI